MSMNIDDFINSFRNNLFSKKDRETQMKAGWFDWCCTVCELKEKTYFIGNLVEKISKDGKVNKTDWYMWFKNNNPLNGPNYDDYHFADTKTGLVQMTIQIDNYLNPKKYTVWGRLTPSSEYNYSLPLFETNSLDDLLIWLNKPWEK